MKKILLTILLIISLANYSYAANTIKFYDRNFVAKASITIGSGTGIDGVYYDGFYYWIVDNASPAYNVEQYYLDSSGSFHKVSSFDLATILGLGAGLSITGIRAITGDGLDLIISYDLEQSTGGPPPIVSVSAEVLKVSKSGKVLARISGFDQLADGSVSDMTYDGYQLIVTFLGVTLIRTIASLR